MNPSKTTLDNLKVILNTIDQLDNDIQSQLFAINESETMEMHYTLMDIADRIEAEIDRAESELDTANSRSYTVYNS